MPAMPSGAHFGRALRGPQAGAPDQRKPSARYDRTTEIPDAGYCLRFATRRVGEKLSTARTKENCDEKDLPLEQKTSNRSMPLNAWKRPRILLKLLRVNRKEQVFMKWTSAKPAGWIAATLCTAIAAFSAGQPQQMSRGEIIMNNACMSCHEYRPIQMQALDTEGWTKLVNSMVAKGATVKADDLPVLVDYLVQEHGPLPDGAGKIIMLDVCTQCHDLHRVNEHRGT